MTFKGTDNFKVSELEYSDTARQYKINNTIPSELEFNVKRLLFFLQDIREKWGSAIKITSGYRCAVLNKLVKGSKTSAHLMCNAVDIWPINGKFEEFKKFIVSYLSDKNFDQCIIEKSGKSQWIHLGLYNNSERQRRQIFKLEQ